MKWFTQKLFLQLIVAFLTAAPALAQVNWPSPEVGQMYRNAQDHAAKGNYKDAAITYKQAIKLAPGIIILYRDLGDALYHSGNYDEAEKVLTPLLENVGADAQCYVLLAENYAAQMDTKHAIAILKKGIEKFFASGDLYHELGEVYGLEKRNDDMLNAWLDGIKKDAGYSENYFDAASIYLHSDKVMWGLFYGETFLAMKHDIAHDDEMKTMLLKAYKTMFDKMVQDDVPKYGKRQRPATVSNFEDAVQQVYAMLTPVVSDDITTENLTMVRTRFLMEWGSTYDKKYPFSLFAYQDKMIRSGHFDMYNEWLFGKAASTAEYKAWNEFHEGDMTRFLQWKNANQFVPVGNEFYNERDMNGVFGRRKK